MKANRNNSQTESVNGYDKPVHVMTHPDYGLTMYKANPETIQEDGETYIVSKIEFVALSADIVNAFDMLAKNKGKGNPYTTASVFSSRLNNDMGILNKNGWELVKKDPEGKKPYFKEVKGKRFFKFRNTHIK